jgi:peptidoglycan-N-acetylglucosamine deacetylase
MPWSVVVLHDLPTGAMLNLERFIGRLHDVGAEIVQDFPPQCVPILRGRLMFSVDQYMAA